MTDDDIKRLREAAQGAAAPGPWAYRISDGAWVVYCAMDTVMRVAEVYGDVDSPEVEADAAYIAAASPDVLLALLSRLEATERERGAERAVAIGHLSQVNAFRAERDALRALLAEARAHLPPPVLGERRLADRIDTALAAKESDRG